MADRIITADDSNPKAMQDSRAIPIELNKLRNAYSRNPIPFRLTGIIDTSVMTGMNTQKWTIDTSRCSPRAMIQLTEINRIWFRSDIAREPSNIRGWRLMT